VIKDSKFAYVNFDDDRLLDVDLDQLLVSIYEVYGKDFVFMLLDEIQNLSGWELFVNRLRRMGLNVFITGSNSKLLSKELATHLTGRHMTIELFPFSFREYLKSAGFAEDAGTTRGIGTLKRELGNYLEIGGFPEIVTGKENPRIYLRELYKKIVERDIINRYEISYKKTFRKLAMSIISNPARDISYNRLKNQFGLGSDHTIKNYLSYLEEAYIIFLISKFSRRPVEIEKSSKKVYVIDTGMIKNISLNFAEDYGRVYENAVAIELFRQKSFDSLLEVYYWKNQQQKEVDFVVRRGLKIEQLIQVCYRMSDQKIREREISSLAEAGRELNCSSLLVITEDEDSEEAAGESTIKYVPLWKWLLNPF
jgi:hypothetical protein